MNLVNTISLVTGASTGIGRAVSAELAKNGSHVIIIGRKLKSLEKTKNLIEQSNGKCSIIVADLRKQEDIENLIKKASDIGTVDILANVAGVWHNNKEVYYGDRLHETPIEEIDELLNVNLRAPIILSRAFVPDMIKNKNGKIINISGTFSNGGAKWLHYYTTKQAVEEFTTGLADELREFNIQVNCISPSDVATESLKKFFPEDANTALLPQQVANFLLYLVSNKTAENISGQTIVIKNNQS